MITTPLKPASAVICYWRIALLLRLDGEVTFNYERCWKIDNFPVTLHILFAASDVCTRQLAVSVSGIHSMSCSTSSLDHEIRFVSCSATISDPLLHMTNLLGIQVNDISVVTEDGAPSGPKESLIWETIPIDSGKRPSSLSEAIRLMSFLMKRGLRVILFCKVGIIWYY